MFVKIGGGTLTFTASNTYTGNTVINAGALTLGGGTLNGSVAGNIVDNAALSFSNPAAQTYSGIDQRQRHGLQECQRYALAERQQQLQRRAGPLAGTLNVNADAALGAPANPVTFAGSSTLAGRRRDRLAGRPQVHDQQRRLRPLSTRTATRCPSRA